MYAVSVELKIKPGLMDKFLLLMQQNAASSRDEPGCVQFDVCRVEGQEDLVVLYELYQTSEDFAAHLKTEHFNAFNTAAGEMIDTSVIRTGARIDPA